MTKRDLVLLTLLFSFLAGLFSPFLFSARLTAFNFGDVYAYHIPLRHMVAERLQAGRLPLWNPYWFAGTPLWANPQTAVLYPPSVLFQFFPVIPALNATWLLHLLLAAGGGYLFFRRLRLSPAGAFTLAAAYALSPFVLGRVAQGVPTLLASLAWIPWTWLAFVSGVPGLLAVVLALQGLSGHPQFAAANAAGLLAAAAWRRRLPGVLAEAAGAGLLTVVQAFPTLEFLSRSVRAHWDAKFAAGYRLPFEALASLLSPAARGTPWSAFSRLPSVWFETSVLYVGLVPLALALWGLGRAARLRRPAAPALIALGLFFAMGGGTIGLLRSPARFAVLALWGLFLAAASGWKDLSPRLSPRAVFLAAALTVLDLGLYGARLVSPQDAWPFVKPDLELAGRLDPSWRVATDPDLANPNKASLYHFSNATGYEAFYLEGAARWASLSEGRPAADGSRTYITRPDTPEMRALSVRYYLTTRDLGAAHLAASKGPLKVYEEPSAGPAAFLEGGAPVPVQEGGPELRRALAPSAGRLVLAQPAYPGWSAWIDGRREPVENWQGFLSAVDVPGPATVALRFRPTFWPGLVLASAAAWVAAAAWSSRALRAGRTA